MKYRLLILDFITYEHITWLVSNTYVTFPAAGNYFSRPKDSTYLHYERSKEFLRPNYSTLLLF